MTDPITPLTPEQLAAQEAKTAHEGYFHRLAVAIDDTANVATDGNDDETISSRMARWDTEDTGLKHEVGKEVSAALGFIQHDHGAKAEAGDLERAKIVEKVEKEAQ